MPDPTPDQYHADQAVAARIVELYRDWVVPERQGKDKPIEFIDISRMDGDSPPPHPRSAEAFEKWIVDKPRWASARFETIIVGWRLCCSGGTERMRDIFDLVAQAEPKAAGFVDSAWDGITDGTDIWLS